MNNGRTNLGWAALTAATLLGGCGTEATTDDQAAPVQVETREETLLGTVQLSDTHSVSFYDLGDGVGMIDERLHADRDRGAPLTLNKMGIEGRTLIDIYQRFAGAKADPVVMNRLSALDGRVTARAEADRLDTQGAADKPPTPTSTPLAERTLPSAPAQGAGLETRQSALGSPGVIPCVEPAWDWPGDAQWFKDNFCSPTNLGVCTSRVTNASYGWDGWRSFFEATFFDQSFCSDSGEQMFYRYHAGFPSYGITQSRLSSVEFSPRVISDLAFTASGHTEFLVNTWSFEANNIALAVHHR